MVGVRRVERDGSHGTRRTIGLRGSLHKRTRGEDPSDDSGTAAAQWATLRPHVGVGALFQIRDSLVIPDTGSTRSHPYAIVGTAVAKKDPARVALSRPVQLSCRSTHKIDQHGARPNSEVEEFLLSKETGLVFSHSDPLMSLSADGVFLFEQFTALVRDLPAAEFLGWLPRQIIDNILYRRGLPPTCGGYPPRKSE